MSKGLTRRVRCPEPVPDRGIYPPQSDNSLNPLFVYRVLWQSATNAVTALKISPTGLQPAPLDQPACERPHQRDIFTTVNYRSLPRRGYRNGGEPGVRNRKTSTCCLFTDLSGTIWQRSKPPNSICIPNNHGADVYVRLNANGGQHGKANKSRQEAKAECRRFWAATTTIRDTRSSRR